MHLFGRTAIMITSSDSPLPWGAGCPINMLGVQLHTMAMSGLSRMRTELAHLLIVPSSAPHPVKTNGQTTSHGYLCSLASAPHHQMKVLAAPLGVAPYRDLSRFHQQKTQHGTSLLGDMSKSSPIPARVLQRNQADVTGDLLAAMEALDFSDDQNEGQCG